MNLAVNFDQLVSIASVVGLTASAIGLALFYWLARRIQARQSVQRWRAQKWLQLAAAGLFLILLVVSVVPRGYTVKRQLVLLWPYGLLLFAWLWPWQGRFHKLLLSMLALSLVAALINVALIPKEQWREATLFIAEHRQANDLVVLEPSYTIAPFDYYDQGRTPREGFPAKADAAWLDAVLNHNDRIWLIESQSVPGLSQPPQAQHWLDAHGTLLDTLDFYRIHLRLYATGRAR